MKLLAVVVPAKDEEATIGELLSRIARVRVPDHTLRAFVVDDGSSDLTSEISSRHGAAVLRHPTNRGLGASLLTGLQAAVGAGADAVVYLDADLEYSPEDIPLVAAPILSGRADYVLGSRFPHGARLMKLSRRLGNHVFTALLSLLAGRRISDGQTGMRAFSREAADRAEIIHDYNYAQVLTLDLLRKGMKMEEVPVSYQPRKHGESFVNWTYPVRVLPAIWRELRSP